MARFAQFAHFAVALTGALAVAAAVLCSSTSLGAAPADDEPPPLRIAISDRVIFGVNPSDAGTAIAVWASEILKTTNFRLASEQNWVQPSDKLLSRVRSGSIDLFCVTVQEYRQIAEHVDTSRIITDERGGDELLIVVREGSGIKTLADLKGKSVILHDNPTINTAEAWLTVTFLKEGLGFPKNVVGSLSKHAKLSQVVLPLYFDQADVCVVTRIGFSTMVEMNPQLSRKLKVLLTSPPTVSTFFACRKDFPARFKKSLFDRFVDLRAHPSTSQLLLLFHSPGFVVRDSSCLRTALSILDTYEQRREMAAGRNR
ncbi:MAG: PhnD/SsuA/transferrin family substrate-binding protein [Bryobacterales bacterium]|nr:PhnD/SsuA/transferrin family substrate-binding protein [Bryobacterales bacterium]